MTRMWARVGWVAFKFYGNPISATRALFGWHSSLAPLRRTVPNKSAFVSGRLFPSAYLPGFPSPAFDRCVEGELCRVLPVPGRVPTLRVVIVAMTRMCALRCEHCVEWDQLNHAEGMSADELLAVARQLRQRGVAQVFLSGGEPLQRFDLLLALTSEMASESDVWILSSGRGLTAERAKRLRDTGLTGVSLSLDHWDAAEHDRFRGHAGSFAAVEQGARHAREAGLVVGLSLCPVRRFVSPENLQLYAEVALRLGASFIQIFEPRAVGHYAGLDVALAPGQQVMLEEFMTRLNLERDAQRYPVVNYVDWNARAAGCRGGDVYAYVDTEGSLHACPFCRDHPVPLLGRDVVGAFEELQAVGCPAQSQQFSLAGRRG